MDVAAPRPALPVAVNTQTNAFTLFMDTVTGNTGQQVDVHVRVLNFTKMLSAQGTISFDTSALTFVQTENYGLSSLTTSNFGTNNAAAGYITFSWTDQTLTGISLTNDTVLFALRFTVKGQSGQSGALNFGAAPTTLEFVDTTYNTLNYLVKPGRVNIITGVTVAGKIQSELGAGIRSVTVTAIGPPNYTDFTDTSGTYSYTLASGSNYTITPSKANDTTVANGITTLDYLLIQRHILVPYCCRVHIR